MKKFSAVLCGVVACFALLLCACNSDSFIAEPLASTNSSSETAVSSSSFNPDGYRTCDQKYEGKFLLYQYNVVISIYEDTWGVNTDFYKCENGKWLGPLDTAPENETGGDVIRVVSSKDLSSSEGERWECNAENEGHVESWNLLMHACKRCPMVHTPDRYARCEQGDWVVCDIPDLRPSPVFNPDEYRTCDQKYEGRYLLYQYSAAYRMYSPYSTEVQTILGAYYKCENGKWSEFSYVAPENKTGGDVVLVVTSNDVVLSDDVFSRDKKENIIRSVLECNAENEGLLQYSYGWEQPPLSAGTWKEQISVARCKQGDWVLCEPSDSSFNPDEYRTCDQKYEGKFLLYQYEAWYYNRESRKQVESIVDVFYKCEKGRWFGPLETAPESKTGGDVIRVAPDDLECNAENEGLVQSWWISEGSSSAKMSTTPFARCEQGDWVVCENPSSSSSLFSSSSGDATESSSSVAASSSSHEILVGPCKTETEDNCEYGTLTDERDGKTYKTVKIHNKWWMAENLDYADSAKTPSLEGKSWCYADDPENCAKYGRLYIWSAATVACPDKWHLPDHDEWYGLLLAVGGYTTAGVVLKSQSGWSSDENSVSGTDAFGFNALPAGIMFGNGTFNGLGDGTDFWSTEESLGGVVAFYLSYDYEYAGLLNYDKNYAFSVRCVMD